MSRYQKNPPDPDDLKQKIELDLNGWLDEVLSEPTKEILVKRCTCGSEKVYGKNTGHSTWCDINR